MAGERDSTEHTSRSRRCSHTRADDGVRSRVRARPCAARTACRQPASGRQAVAPRASRSPPQPVARGVRFLPRRPRQFARAAFGLTPTRGGASSPSKPVGYPCGALFRAAAAGPGGVHQHREGHAGRTTEGTAPSARHNLEGLLDRLEQFDASGLAPPAGFRAQATVLVVTRVTFALLGAGGTCLAASLE
jgi:hypothetical protein